MLNICCSTYVVMLHYGLLVDYNVFYMGQTALYWIKKILNIDSNGSQKS